MKKRLLALSMAVVMAFGLTACGGSSSGNAGTTAAAGGSETTAAAASGKTYKIKLHHDLAEDSSQHEGAAALFRSRSSRTIHWVLMRKLLRCFRLVL